MSGTPNIVRERDEATSWEATYVCVAHNRPNAAGGGEFGEGVIGEMGLREFPSSFCGPTQIRMPACAQSPFQAERCGPDLTMSSYSPFCCSDVCCAWERSTLRRPQDARSVGKGFHRAPAMTSKLLSVLPIFNIVHFSNSECPAANSVAQRCNNALLTV